jgi:2-polyprenyl-3-methyl-5-hydroxy-6-metoxy-1,4-benzoquinol methylase
MRLTSRWDHAWSAIVSRSTWLHLPVACALLVQSALFAQTPSPQTQAMGRSWDEAYTDPGPPAFSVEPNAFLVEVTRGLTPGTALDVGMGQGRNAIHLATRGWQVTGFDVSQAGIERTKQAARAAGVNVTALQQSSAEFDWGTNRWDLIVLAYFPGLRAALPRVLESLRPGGLVVVEAFHADAAADRPPGPGPGVTFGDNELLTVFSGLRTLRYEDVRARADWGLFETRLVRLAARKKS